jgi:hypothetical protein
LKVHLTNSAGKSGKATQLKPHQKLKISNGCCLTRQHPLKDLFKSLRKYTMTVQAIVEKYQFEPLDLQQNYGENMLLFIGWDHHTYFVRHMLLWFHQNKAYKP